MQQFVRAAVSNAVWMLGKYCEAAACRVGREVTAASLAGLHGRGLVQAGLWAGEVEAEAGVDASTCAHLPEHRFPALVHVLRTLALAHGLERN